jgi:hypothetical protein
MSRGGSRIALSVRDLRIPLPEFRDVLSHEIVSTL